MDAEWNIIYDKLAKCVASGAQVVLSRLAIGDLATQYFADRGIFCAGRVADDDMQRVAKATGGFDVWGGGWGVGVGWGWGLGGGGAAAAQKLTSGLEPRGLLLGIAGFLAWRDPSGQ